MSRSLASLLLALPLALISPPSSIGQSSCEASPVTLRLQSIAPAVGAPPVWMTGGSLGCWCGERPLKTAWIVARAAGNKLEVHGSGLGAETPVYFPRQLGDRRASFLVKDIDQSRVPLGGFDETEWQQYAFLMGYVSYPRPGCYHLVATVGETVTDLVVDQRRCPDCTVAPSPPE